MINLAQAIARLVDALSISSCTSNQSVIHFSWQDEIDLLSWLDAQTVFPQFYWQARDGEEEVIALGQVKIFRCPVSAEQSLDDNQRIWGGYAFDPDSNDNDSALASSYFFLPQIELTRRGKNATLIVNIGEDPLKAQQTLSKIVLSNHRLCSPCCHILSEVHQPKNADWLDMVEEALCTIEKTQLQKVVLARKTTLALDRCISGAQLLKASHEENKHNFHFLLAIDESRTFIGSTPERLFFRQELNMLTEAIAGTIGRSPCAKEDMQLAQWLLNDHKNIYENKLVVDDITSRMTPFCGQLAVDEKPYLVPLRRVQHLKRAITAFLHPDVSSANLLNALHPTAAIAGLPRQMALDFIKEKEPFDRMWYSGAVGYIQKARSEFCVAIRSALVTGNQVHLFAGAGIVPGSVPMDEWKELNRKMATLKTLLRSISDLGIMEEAG